MGRRAEHDHVAEGGGRPTGAPRMGRVKWTGAQGLLAVCAGLAGGAGSTLGQMVALTLIAVPLAVACVVGVTVHGLVVALVVASQLNGLRVPLAGFHFLPEHFAIVALAAVLLLRTPSVLLRRPAAYEVLLLAWIGWNGIASLAFSINVRESLGIVGWLALAWLILWCVRGYLSAAPAEARRVLDTGLAVASVLGVVGFVTWIAGILGLFAIGLQPEYVTGTAAARVFSFEANLFGSTELLWLFLAMRWRVVNDRDTPPWQIVGLLLGIVSSMTRAVWLATILVLVVTWLARRDRRRWAGALGGKSARKRSGQALVVWLLALVFVVAFGGPAAEKFESALDFGSSTGVERVRNWKVALDDLGSSRSYLLGRGTNSYGQRHLSRTVAGEPDYLGNLGLTVLYDTGLLGVLLFGGAMVLFVLRRHTGWGRLFKVLFVVVLMIVGAAASPIWFGYVWVAVAAIDTVWRREHFDVAGCTHEPSRAQGGLAR